TCWPVRVLIFTPPGASISKLTAGRPIWSVVWPALVTEYSPSAGGKREVGVSQQRVQYSPAGYSGRWPRVVKNEGVADSGLQVSTSISRLLWSQPSIWLILHHLASAFRMLRGPSSWNSRRRRAISRAVVLGSTVMRNVSTPAPLMRRTRSLGSSRVVRSL